MGCKKCKVTIVTRTLVASGEKKKIAGPLATSSYYWFVPSDAVPYITVCWTLPCFMFIHLTCSTRRPMLYSAAFDQPAVASAPRSLSCFRQIIVFILGGSTYEEAKAVVEYNEKNPGQRVVLGGTGVLNPDAFLAALTAASGSNVGAGATAGTGVDHGPGRV